MEKELTVAKNMASCRFYRDPLQKVDFIHISKNSHKINILWHQN